MQTNEPCGKAVERDTIPKPGGLGSGGPAPAGLFDLVRCLFNVCSKSVQWPGTMTKDGRLSCGKTSKPFSTVCPHNRRARALPRTRI